MKTNTVKKILNRYAKSLAFMETEAVQDGTLKDSEQYKVDKMAFNLAIQLIERGNT